MPTGKIVRVVRAGGWGFIRRDTQQGNRQEELFFERSGLRDIAFHALQKGQPVQFDVVRDPRDPTRQQATNVRPVAGQELVQ